MMVLDKQDNLPFVSFGAKMSIPCSINERFGASPDDMSTRLPHVPQHCTDYILSVGEIFDSPAGAPIIIFIFIGYRLFVHQRIKVITFKI